MLRALAALVILIASVSIATCKDLIDSLRGQSVTILTQTGQGSGVLVKGTNGLVYVWTSAHVVDESTNRIMVVRPIWGPLRPPAWSEGGIIGEVRYFAKLERMSVEEDLALLELPKGAELSETVLFADKSDRIRAGLRVVHVGSMVGLYEGVTRGEIAGVGRAGIGQWKVLDQLTCTAAPGSSGGGVWNAKTGHLVGLLVAGMSDNVVFMVPARSMEAWANREGIGWACAKECANPVQKNRN